MAFVNGLLANKPFIVESLLSFVDEERQRIVGAGLVNRESCDRYLGGVLKKLAEIDSDDGMISKLTQLYESMQNVRLQGDRFFEEEAKSEPPVVQPTIVQDKAAQIQVGKVEAFLECELEKVAYSLGCAGNHRLAFEVEKVIQSIKRGE
jgi:hypothetical protein